MKNHFLLADVHPAALEWVNSVLSERSIPPVTELELVRERAWSLVAKVRHQHGVWYFKCLPSYFEQELAITEYLSKKDPVYVCEFIAKQVDQRFLLISDGGPMLREHYEDTLDPQCWFEALDAYAKLQIAVMNDDALHSLGLPNRSLVSLPEQVKPHINWAKKFNGEDEEDQFRSEHSHLLVDALENWADLIQGLYQYGVTDTVHHGDFHDGNLAYRTHPVIFDWGDASISHPFMSLRSVFGSIERRFGFAEHSTDMEPFIEAYLSPWLQFASMPELKEMFQQAKRVWALVSFLSWKHGLSNQFDERATQYNYALPALLREFVEAQRDDR